MKSVILTSLLAIVTTFGLGPNAVAADKEKGKTVSVTGCLEKNGDKSGEYSIMGSDGKKYGLRSKNVNLENHLNHKVTVTGKMKEEEQSADRPAKAGHTEYADIDVTNLKMISTTCTQ
jgi:hypothetical protein